MDRVTEAGVPRAAALPPKLSLPSIALLTAGRDKPYALGLAGALLGQGVELDFIGSNEVDGAELHGNSHLRFLNLRGDQRVDASFLKKFVRVIKYYARLIAYAATARPKIFHVLWNNKFELFDRTLLMLYYRLLGKEIVFTAHNVNAGARDGNDSWLNRATLRIQYQLCRHIFVHTRRMKQELLDDFNIPENRVTVIPFGINDTVPVTNLSTLEAKQRLGLAEQHKVLLFFGNIAPYKGLEYLIEAFSEICASDALYRLIVVGRPKGDPEYWSQVRNLMASTLVAGKIIERIEYIPDAETELYFKAADILILPYTHIFQSGVLFLGYNFGLPVIATDVGSLRDEIIDGETGFVCKPRDVKDLGRKIDAFFSHELYRQRVKRRQMIKEFAAKRYSWDEVAQVIVNVYSAISNFKVTESRTSPGLS